MGVGVGECSFFVLFFVFKTYRWSFFLILMPMSAVDPPKKFAVNVGDGTAVIPKPLSTPI